VDVLSSHLALFFVSSLDSIWAGLRLIPLSILASSNGMSWLIDRVVWFVGCGWLAIVVHGWVSPMFELSPCSFDL
jgi:hypothetical protein